MEPTNQSLAELLEVKRRRSIRSNLDEWALCCGKTPALHHSFINRLLEKVSLGVIAKLMVFLPFGAAKSTYTSIHLPPWYFAQIKDKLNGKNILACSHKDELAVSFGRKARDLIKEHHLALGYKVKADSAAADHWFTTNGCEYQAAGVGAGIAGIRADLGIIDDFHGKKEDADSQSQRDKVWDWYNWDFKPRLKPNASQIIVNTRWHMDDLAGRLLDKEKGEWTVVDIPLLAKENDPLGRKEGDLLWPEWFNQKTVTEAKKDPRLFNCAYQNNPIPESGNYFEKEWIQTYTPGEMPKNLKFYVGSDHAVSLRQESDSSVILIIGLDEQHNMWVQPELIWGKFPTDKIVEEMIRINKAYHPLSWWAGKEHITQSIGPFLNQRMVETSSYIPLIETPSTRDLSTRAQPIKGRMRTGKVFWPGYASWWPEVYQQLLGFPLATHDDVIAALSEVGRGLDCMIVPQSLPKPEHYDTSWKPTMKWVREGESRRNRQHSIKLLDR